MKKAHDTYQIDAAKYYIDQATGFLHVPITMGRVGIMYYPENEQRRYFPPATLTAALDSANYAIVTRQHPQNFVTTENVDEVNKGITKEGSIFDGKKNRGEVIIYDRAYIEDILSKNIVEISPGYSYDDDGQPGKNELGEFDCTVTSIKYNHFAGVEKGRNGPDVKFQIDQKGKKMEKKIERSLPTFKVALDVLLPGVVIIYEEVDKTAMDTMFSREEILKNKVSQQKFDMEVLEANLTTEKATAKKLKTANDGMVSVEDINKMAGEIVDVREVAAKIGLDCSEQTDPHEMKKSILKKILPDAYKTLEDKELLDNKQALDASYAVCRSNMGLNKEIMQINEALRQGSKNQQIMSKISTVGDLMAQTRSI